MEKTDTTVIDETRHEAAYTSSQPDEIATESDVDTMLAKLQEPDEEEDLS